MKNITFMSERLKEIRKKDGSTQKEFGEKVGCSMASISAYENGSKVPPTPTLVKIAETCNCSIDWLFGLKDSSTLNNKVSSAVTYSDYIKKLFALDDDSVSLLLDIIHELPSFDMPPEMLTDPRTNSEVYSILFGDSVLNIFLKTWDKIRVLYRDGTIDATIYEAWKEKVIRDFDSPIIQTNTDWDNFYDTYLSSKNSSLSEYDATIEALQNIDILPLF